jgi:hypothetical protein
MNVDLKLLPRVDESNGFILFGSPDSVGKGFDQYVIAHANVWVTFHVVPPSPLVSDMEMKRWFEAYAATASVVC